MGMINRLIARRMRFLTKACTGRQAAPENHTPLADALLLERGLREAGQPRGADGNTGVIYLEKDAQAPPLGAVVTGYLYFDNALLGYTYELLSLEEAVETARRRARQKE